MGHNLSWTMGRQLASFDGITYTYNEDGIRTSKTVDNVTTTYYLDETNIIEQITGNTVLHFYYDSNDEVIGFEYNSDNYYYVKNAMGDIVGIADSDGNLVASYTYDSWGKVLSVTGSDTVIGNLNPFRYRGYYYDAETGLYYLQSRYYDPEVGRFINCDDVNYLSVTKMLLYHNAFAYCDNDPVNYHDPFGKTKVKMLRKISTAYKGNNTLRTLSVLISKNFKNMYLAFHEMAQILIANKLKSLYYQEITLEMLCSDNVHEVDVYAKYDTRRGMKEYIWEVKPKGTSAEKQLRLYQKLNKNFLRGGNVGTIVRKISSKLFMKIEFNDRGGAFYSFENSKRQRITNSELKRSIENGVYAAIGIGAGAVFSVAAMAIIASLGTATAPAIGASAAATTVGASVTPEILMIIIPIAAEFSKAA